ncbi:MAG TPA: DUF3306 domain-containing protein [Usitatibacteraceae bacterium]|nr:DUF3306 domain-containing protein [Usitatibacteraceae bacterium]
MSDAKDRPEGSEPLLSRWSRRKIEARKGLAGENDAAPTPMPNPSAGAAFAAKTPGTPLPEPGLPPVPDEKPTLPALDTLAPDSDFAPFMAPDVAPATRNAALRKLFSDPHYNVMDGLDTYIDDYSKPDPIPMAMLKSLVQTRGMFADHVDALAKATDSAPADNPPEATGAGPDEPAPVAAASPSAVPVDPPAPPEGPLTQHK